MLRATIVIFLVGAFFVPRASAGTEDVQRFLESRVHSDPDDFIAWNRLADLYLERRRSTGADGYLERAAAAAASSLQAAPALRNAGGLAVRARVELAQHRFASARDRAPELGRLLPDKGLPLELLGDALLELGDYTEASRTYHRMQQLEGMSVEIEARFARLDVVHGRLDDARNRLTRALAFAEALVPPARDTVAWCQVQLGELAFKTGRWDAAERHYQAALTALPDGYVAREHLAELRGAQGRTEEAITLYEQVIATVPRPDLQQALGDLYAFAGRETEAGPWYDRAIASYLRSVAQGEVQYFHHLAGFYADSRVDGPETVAWARRDLELRHSIYAHDALAWALYKDGQTAAAVTASGRALATGVKDAHILYHAAMIQMSAGDVEGGAQALRQAVAVNPRSNTFHAHR
jgi:tetratricopeptide (TPR) repeat protein